MPPLAAADTDDSSASPVTIAGFTLGAKRRVVIDLALLLVLFALLGGFFDMRASLRNQTEAFRSLSVRLDAIEARERHLTTGVATKADIDRLERRFERMQELLITSPRPR